MGELSLDNGRRCFGTWIFQYRITADCSSHNYYCLDSNSVWDIRDCPHITAYNVVYCVRTPYCYAAVVSIQMEPPLVFRSYLQKKEVILMISVFVYIRGAVKSCQAVFYESLLFHFTDIRKFTSYLWSRSLIQRKFNIVINGLANLFVFSNFIIRKLSIYWLLKSCQSNIYTYHML